MTGVAVIGDRNPEFVTHRAIDAALAGIGGRWMATDAIDLDAVSAVWLAPGTPYRDEGAVFEAIRHCRETGVPFLGTCGGFQYAVVEFARNAAGAEGAAHAESEPDAGDPVVRRLSCSLVGEERTVTCVPGTRLAAICGTQPFSGFHWCNYGLNDAWADALEDAGLVVSARAEDAGVEGIELPSHPFFLATLFQPQVSAPDHPLIAALGNAARKGMPV